MISLNIIGVKNNLIIFQNLNKNCIISRSVNQSIKMMNCLISIISSNGDGGAIFIVNKKLSLYINDTSFYQCLSTNGEGGAIYFNLGFNIQLVKNCVLYCKS